MGLFLDLEIEESILCRRYGPLVVLLWDTTSWPDGAKTEDGLLLRKPDSCCLSSARESTIAVVAVASLGLLLYSGPCEPFKECSVAAAPIHQENGEQPQNNAFASAQGSLERQHGPWYVATPSTPGTQHSRSTDSYADDGYVHDASYKLEPEGSVPPPDADEDMGGQQAINQEDCWTVIDAFFEEKGLVRQQLESFNEFVDNTMQELVDENSTLTMDQYAQHSGADGDQTVRI